MNLKSDTWKILAAGFTVATLSPIGAAEAVTLIYTDSVDRRITNFADAFSITQFDTSLGTLNSVTFELTGTVDGTIGLENRDNGPATVSGTLRARIALESPMGDPLVVVLPDATESELLPAYDGLTNFDGASGETFTGLTNTRTNSATLTSGFDAFLGTGDIALGVSATGESFAQGTGNFASFFDTFAAANLRVIYDYTAAPTDVPEPAMSLAAFALVGAGAAKLRKRAQHS
jgi:hypothetical protein